MNNRQKTTLIMVALLVSFNILFPPYIIEYNNNILERGYTFIFTMPSYNNIQANIDFETFLAQLIAIIVLGSIVILFFMNKQIKKADKYVQYEEKHNTEDEKKSISKNKEILNTVSENNTHFHGNKNISWDTINYQQKKIYTLLKVGIFFSIIWLFGIGSIIAFRNGLKAKAIINNNPGLSGKGGAWWCLIVGGIGILLLIPILILAIINNIV